MEQLCFRLIAANHTGSCTAYELTKVKGLKCVLFEQYDFLHRRAAPRASNSNRNSKAASRAVPHDNRVAGKAAQGAGRRKKVDGQQCRQMQGRLAFTHLEYARGATAKLAQAWAATRSCLCSCKRRSCGTHWLAQWHDAVLAAKRAVFLALRRRGSSHGESRIIRKTYKQEHFTAMMAQARVPLPLLGHLCSSGRRTSLRLQAPDFIHFYFPTHARRRSGRERKGKPISA